MTDVQEEDGIIYHTVAWELAPGRYCCRINAEERLRKMQNHTGEHIVSGLICRSYDCANVGFHLGTPMTVDFSAELSWEQLMNIERRANEIVRENRRISTSFPSAEELATMDYRSKLELKENVRIVEIEGVDRCACCAPHMESTGGVGLIKILSSTRHRGGIRIELVCGMDALDIVRGLQSSVTSISEQLSAPRTEVGEAVERLVAERDGLKFRMAGLEMKMALSRAASAEPTDGCLCLFEEIGSEEARRELVNALMNKCAVAAVFSQTESGYRYIIGSKSVNLRDKARELNAAIGGRGGGRPEMISGTATADSAAIEAAVAALKAP